VEEILIHHKEESYRKLFCMSMFFAFKKGCFLLETEYILHTHTNAKKGEGGTTGWTGFLRMCMLMYGQMKKTQR